MINKLYQIGVLSSIILIWYQLHLAKNEQYDANYGLAISAFLISLVVTVVIICLWFFKKEFLRRNKMLTMFFIITSSPITIITYIEFYNVFVRRFFQLE